MARSRRSTGLVTVLLLALCALPSSRAVSTAFEKALLLKLRQLCPAIAISTTSNGKVLNNWSSASFCDWDNISCTPDKKHVQSIHFDFDAAFHNTQLPKPAPGKPNYRVCKLLPDLWKLNQLETLIIRNAAKKNASVAGPLPGDVWGAQGAFFSLFTLDLSNNGIKATIPAGWGKPAPAGFPNLRELDLHRNGLTGTLPSWGINGSALPNLEFVDVTYNPDLKGKFPLSWQSVGQFAEMTNPVTNNQPLIVIRPKTQIGGCVPPLIPTANVVKDTASGYQPVGLQSCPTIG